MLILKSKKSLYHFYIFSRTLWLLDCIKYVTWQYYTTRHIRNSNSVKRKLSTKIAQIETILMNKQDNNLYFIKK